VFAPGSGGDHDDTAGAKQGVAAGQDLGEPVGQAGEVAVGELPLSVPSL
jgi:hypothetical protein